MSDTAIAYVAWAAIWALLGLIPATLASRKGRSFWGYWWLSVLVPCGFLVTLIWALCVKRRQPKLREVTP